MYYNLLYYSLREWLCERDSISLFNFRKTNVLGARNMWNEKEWLTQTPIFLFLIFSHLFPMHCREMFSLNCHTLLWQPNFIQASEQSRPTYNHGRCIFHMSSDSRKEKIFEREREVSGCIDSLPSTPLFFTDEMYCQSAITKWPIVWMKTGFLTLPESWKNSLVRRGASADINCCSDSLVRTW